MHIDIHTPCSPNSPHNYTDEDPLIAGTKVALARLPDRSVSGPFRNVTGKLGYKWGLS